MKIKQAKIKIKETDEYLLICLDDDKLGIHYPLNLPCPTRELFCRAFEMPEEEINYPVRFMALYWSCYGDECMATNGRYSRTSNHEPFLYYIWHKRNRPYLTAYNFGSSENEEDHWLVFDFEKERLYAIGKGQAALMLEAQYVDIAKPQTEDKVLWEGLIDNIEMTVKGFEKIDIEQMKQAYNKSLETFAEWEQWLDNAYSGNNHIPKNRQI